MKEDFAKAESIEQCRNMWIAVVDLAVKDLKHKDFNMRMEAVKFFKKKDGPFKIICDIIGLDADSIRKELLH